MYNVLYEDQIWSIHRNKWSQLSYLLCTDHGMISYLLHTDHGWLQYLLVVWCNLLCHWTHTEVDMLLQWIYIYQNVPWCSWILCCDTTVADLHSKILDAAPPESPNSFNFMQFLGKFGKNRMLAPPWRVGAPSSGKSWIRHCTIYLWKCFTNILHAYIFVIKLYIINTWLKIKIVMIMSSMTIVITFRWTTLNTRTKYVKNVMSTIKYTCIQKFLNCK